MMTNRRCSISCRRGSVMMEYVILQLVFTIGISFAGIGLGRWMNEQFYSHSTGLTTPEASGGNKSAGRAMQAFYQRILAGLSLPVP